MDDQQKMEEAAGHPLRRETDIKTTNELSVTVGRLESSLANTNIAFRDFTQRTEHNIDRLAKSIDDLGKTQLLGKQTNWGMIASWAAVLVILLGLVVYQPLQELRVGISTHQEDGHPESVLSKLEIINSTNVKQHAVIAQWHDKTDVWIQKQHAAIASMQERILDIEREVYAGTTYRSGRPIRPSVNTNQQ